MDALTQLSTALAGRYTIEREIGRGGMATVYSARDVRHDRLVAVKVLDPELGAVLGVERFLSEIRVTANLQHPNLLPLFDSGEADGLLFYVMPFVDGESLRARLDREKQLPIDEAIRVAVAVANALEYAHAHGVIHRDLKPENILLQAGQPVVADFGIALAVSNAGGSRITQTGLSLGTPQYMSPEQATGDRAVDGRTDIYSLAAVLYEMLTGEAPHSGNTAQAIIAKLMTDDVRPLTLLRRSVPAQIDLAVRHALERLPADRFASAREFAEALQARPDSTLALSAAWAAPARRRGIAARLRDPVTLVLAAVTIAAIAIPRRASRAPDGGTTVTNLVPPPNMEFSEAESFGALSPDGRRFAFVTLGSLGETKLWVRRFDTLLAQPLPGTEGARAPFWSPDGKFVAFYAKDGLFVTDVVGGAPRFVCRIGQSFGGSWGSGDVIVVATDTGIVRASPSGSTCSVAIPHDSLRGGFRHPTLTADATHVLFTNVGQRSRILAGELATGRTQVLADQIADPTIVGSDILVFGQTGAEGESRLFAQRFDARALRLVGTPVPVTAGVRTSAGIFAYCVAEDGLVYLPGLGDHGELRTDRTGRVLDTLRVEGAWMHAWAQSHAWVAHTRDLSVTSFDVGKHIDVPVRPVPDGSYAGPAWSPGDTLLAFLECRDDACIIAGVRMADGHDTVLTKLDTLQRMWPAAWSPDGRYLIATRIRQYSAQSAEIWAYDTRERKFMPLVTPGYSVLEPAVSPDGRWLAYRSQESGTPEVVVRPFLRPGAAQRVSIAGGRLPYWRAGGRELLFQAPDGRVIAADIQPGPTLTIGTPRALFAAPGWTRHLFFDTGTSFGVSADGQQFTFRMTATSPTAVLVQNWQALLK